MTADIEPEQVVRCADGSVECVFRLRADYVGFAGHFPGDPILPGMCHLDLALRALRIAVGAPCDVASVVRARFSRKVRPDEELRVVVRRAPQGATPDRWHARHFVGTERAADLVLDVGIPGGRGAPRS